MVKPARSELREDSPLWFFAYAGPVVGAIAALGYLVHTWAADGSAPLLSQHRVLIALAIAGAFTLVGAALTLILARLTATRPQRHR